MIFRELFEALYDPEYLKHLKVFNVVWKFRLAMTRLFVFALTLDLLTVYVIFATKRETASQHMLQQQYTIQDVAFRLKSNIKTMI